MKLRALDSLNQGRSWLMGHAMGRSDMSGRICLFFDCLGFSRDAREQFSTYALALAGICDVVALIHKPLHMNLTPPDIDHVMLEDSDIFDSFPHGKADPRLVVPGNCDLKLIAGARARPNHEIYLRIEEDVWCTGDLLRAFELMIGIACTCDLAASYVMSHDEDPDWMWWPSLQAPDSTPLEKEAQGVRAFFPLMSVSQRFLRAYEQHLAAGWRGHYETLMPTLADIGGFVTTDLAQTTPALTQFPQFALFEVTELEKSIPLFVHPVKSQQARLAMRKRIEQIRRGGAPAV